MDSASNHPGHEGIERELLAGLLACRAGVIAESQFIDALGSLVAEEPASLVELLTQRGWIAEVDRNRIQADSDELLRAHAGDVRAAVAGALAQLRRSAAPTQEARGRPGEGHGDAGQATVLYSQVGMPTEQGFPALPDDRSYSPREALPDKPRYTRTSVHSSGGMGTVWLAYDAHLGRKVALKELHKDASSNPNVPVRFLREARITGQLEHPGVVPVYELGRDAETGRPFYTMRFVRGRTLTQAAHSFHRRRLNGLDEPLDFVKLLTAFVSVCHTVAFAHSRDIVHRDLKGENIILGDFGEVIVLDWGLAKRLDQSDDGEETAAGLPSPMESARMPGQTMMGQVMGTPAYMSPEQAEGRLDLLGPATDIFGAGAVLYEILTGRAPFSGTTTVEILQRALQSEILPPQAYWPDVPADLEQICLKALAKEPQRRHASASELAHDVQGWQDRQRRKAEDDLRQAGARLMEQQAALVQLTRSDVLAASTRSEVFLRMTQVSAQTLKVERVSIWLYTASRDAIVCELLYELKTGRTSSGLELRAEVFPAYFEALKTSEVIPAHDARTDPRTREFTDSYLTPLDIGAIMDAPIHVSGQMRGVVCHEHVGSARNWTPDEQLFAIAIANLVAQAIG